MLFDALFNERMFPKLLNHAVHVVMKCTVIVVLLVLLHVITTKLLLHVQGSVWKDVFVNQDMSETVKEIVFYQKSAHKVIA